VPGQPKFENPNTPNGYFIPDHKFPKITALLKPSLSQALRSFPSLSERNFTLLALCLPSDSDPLRSCMASTPSKATACRKVRVVAKIRGFTGSEAEISTDSPWISVNKPSGEASDNVTISFRDQPGRYFYFNTISCFLFSIQEIEFP
jgi:hypothetical protein